MAKKSMGIFDWLTLIVSLIVSIGVGGLFVAGGFLNVVLLNLLPLIVHQIVGWIIIAGGIIGFIGTLLK